MSEPEYSFVAWKRRLGSCRLPKQSVRLSRQGELTLSDDLFEGHFSLEFWGVELFVDTTQKAIGIKPSNDKANGFQFRRRGKALKAQTVSLLGFVVKNDIQPMQYTAKWSDKNKMLIFNYRTLEEITK